MIFFAILFLVRRFNSLVLHCASLLRTIFASSARAHERVHVQNVRDFPQTKLIKNIFDGEKKFDSRKRFFWKIVPNWVYFGLAKTSS